MFEFEYSIKVVFLSMHLKNHQNFKGAMRNEHSVMDGEMAL